MGGRITSMRLRLAIGFGVALVAALLLVPSAVPAPKVATTTDKAQVVTVIRPLEPNGCSYTGIIRWQAVKGVSSYTVLFNDSAFNPPEQSAVVSEPFADDQRDPAYPPLNAPAGTHQGVWTGSTSSGPCESYDYSERLTNARVEYTAVLGEIAGRVADREGHGVPDVRIQAKGKASLHAETDFDGYYSIEVPKDKLGAYDVAPSGPGNFKPKSTKVQAHKGKRAEANFTEGCTAGSDAKRAEQFRPLNGLYVYPQITPSAEGGLVVSLYYQCTKQTLFANIKKAGASWPQVTCTDGSTLQILGSDTTLRPIKFAGGHKFAFDDEHGERRGSGWLLSRISFNGDFFKKDQASIGIVRVVYDHRHLPGGGTCSYEDPFIYDVFLAEENPTPFRVAPLFATR